MTRIIVAGVMFLALCGFATVSQRLLSVTSASGTPSFTAFLTWTDYGAHVNTASQLVWTDYGAHVE